MSYAFPKFGLSRSLNNENKAVQNCPLKRGREN